MLKETTVGVIGGGVVGQATSRSLIEHVREVRVYDVRPERRTHHLAGMADCDLVFLCLPTPQCSGTLECDTDAVERMLAHFGGLLHRHPLVLKSTVPVGFTRQMAGKYGLTNLVHSPEFLTARCADADAAMPNRLVIGQPNLTRGEGGIFRGMVRLQQLYQERWPGVPILTMTSDESEALKLAQNSFFALKVLYWNLVKSFTERRGLDWDSIKIGIQLDRHINPSHMQVPGPDGRPGAGGACLRKDLANFIDCLKSAGVSCDILLSAQEYNNDIRGEE